MADNGSVSGLARFAAKRAVWVLLAWVALATALNLLVPQLEEVAARDSSPVVPSYAPSIVAMKDMDEAFGNGESQSFVVIAMERDGGLAPADKRYAGRLADVLTRDRENVSFVQDVRERPELLKALTSRDGEARYLLVGITGQTGAPSSIRQVTAVRDVAADLAPAGLEVAVTGPTATITDLATETEDSIVRITVVTIGLIAIILWLIYRSFAVTALVLTVVGIGLGLARAVTAWCGLTGIFTVSTFSGSFLTAVVLGAGTDYAVFLVSRYHELRREGVPPREAAATAGTRITSVVVGSALTVVLACGCMLLAELGFFSTTGPAIAVSVAINLAVALTLTPALLALAGSRGWCEPRPERAGSLWPRIAGTVAAHPGRMLALSLLPLLALAALAPLLQVSYDTRDSQPDDTESNRGYALLDRHYPVNEILPDYVLIQSDHDLRNPRDLALLERAASATAQEEGVVMVRSITRPLGRPITDASVARQAGIVGVRLDRASDRVGDGEQGAEQLADGAGQLGDGADELSDGSGQLADGADRAVDGAGRLVRGTADLEQGLRRLLAGADQAVTGAGRLGGGMRQLARGLETGADQVQLAVDGLGLAYDALRTKSLTCNVDPACRQAREGIRRIWVAERDELLPGLRRAATAARSLADGTVDLQTGLRRLRDGLRQARAGADLLNDGQQTFAEQLGGLADGADQLADGAGRLAEGAGRLEGGTEEVATSLPELRRGLSRAATYLRRTSVVADDPAIGGFYLPPTALKDERFAAAMGLFLSEDGRTARFAVLGSTDAFDEEAADRTVEIRETVEQSLRGTRLDDAEVSTTGMAATNADLAAYSQSDMRLVALTALIAVFLVLLVLLRSLVAAAVLMATVVLSYASAMGLSVLVWQELLGIEIDWTVAAVAFTILVAVGADYNLLLTKRMHEEAPDGDAAGIARATAATGSVITSAGVIFAASMFALMAGSVTTMTQVGFTIGAGLLLDTFVVRSLLVPAAATLLGPRLWWPGAKASR
ncbi:MMPL family transporter [Nocardioides antri]|uniref:MMPL family transporter n=1 Tax=Nocardioides antri TaxID=2607659 RepID=A0A5B1M4S5_9ACTN|nr:MMPL family transporter [Nocardioides antri]KAA1427761.1 MMPL family transporter [Nocardioides antri]